MFDKNEEGIGDSISGESVSTVYCILSIVQFIQTRTKHIGGTLSVRVCLDGAVRAISG